MTNEPPEYCPHCGGELRAVDPPTVFRCSECEQPTFYNPTPSARVAVVDGESLLLCAVGVPGVEDTWETPGGRLEADENPDVAAARELQEETGLRVDPEQLTLFDVRSFQSIPDRYKVRLCYAVGRDATAGTLRAGTEPDSVKFWSPERFVSEEQILSDRQPAETRALSWWLENARAALDGTE